MNYLDVTSVLAALSEEFGDVDFRPAPLLAAQDRSKEQTCIKVPAERLPEVMSFLKADSRCRFDQVADLTCVDYLEFPDAADRYGVTYTLVSTELGHRLWVKCFANDPAPEIPSVTPIWKGADWQEREVWDLFGVKFKGHYDLRRIMTWEGFESHPLRKDYPLRGKGERTSFTRIERDSV